MSSTQDTTPGGAQTQSSDAEQSLPFAAVLAGLWRQQRTGRLDIVADSVATSVYMRDGVVVFAAQGAEGSAFGKTLVDSGLINNAQLSQAVNLLTERVFDNEQQELCEAMVELGFVTAEKLLTTLRAQVCKTVASCFGVTQLQGKFDEGVHHLEDIADFGSPTEVVWMAGVKYARPDRLSRFLEPYDSTYPSLLHTPEQTSERFALATRETTFLQAFTGRQTIRQLRDYSVLDPIHASQVLTGLLLGRAVQLSHEPAMVEKPADEPPPAVESQAAPAKPPISRTSTGLKRVPTAEDRFGVTGAMKAMVDRFRHTPLRGTPVQEQHSMAQPVESPEDRAATAVEAERAFDRGMDYFRAERWPEACEAFEQAAELNNDGPDYQLWATWMAYRVAKKKAKRKAADHAQQVASRAYATNGKNPLANLVLGHLAAQQGKVERARRHLLVAGQQDTTGLLHADDELRALAPSNPRGRPSRPKGR